MLALLFQPVPPHLLLQKWSPQISHDFSCPQIEPLYFLPAMEVVPAPWTDAAVVESCSRFFKQLGQKPAILKKEVPGFLINRVQSMLYREAYRLVHVSFLNVNVRFDPKLSRRAKRLRNWSNIPQICPILVLCDPIWSHSWHRWSLVINIVLLQKK